jgi:outer membrane protein OmpA-like peptidoglycan-associated protein
MVLIGALAVLAAAAPAGAETFRYKYAAGDQYRIVSTVEEDVYLDRAFSHHAQILNRIAVTVTGAANGGGTLKAVFQTSEQAQGAAGTAFAWAREYESEFGRDELGRCAVPPQYWMPVVRDVPVFPAGDVAAGAGWSADGVEVHDFRDAFGIADPYRIPFTASYRYLGERPFGGASYPAFTVSYRLFDEPAKPARLTPPVVNGVARDPVWPVRIMGASDQTVYWDRALGQPAAYSESFRVVFELSDGRTVEYRGTASADLVEAAPMDKGQVADAIAKDIARLDIPDAAVRVTEAGVAISLDNIQFAPDSAEFLPGEAAKLDRIGDILARYPDRDILVGGHTALAGTEAGRQKLSEQRAAAVAAYLIGRGVRAADRVVVRGYGATVPLADNLTETGRQRNRRVEITLLEN